MTPHKAVFGRNFPWELRLNEKERDSYVVPDVDVDVEPEVDSE